jgi:hypothetical protein
VLAADPVADVSFAFDVEAADVAHDLAVGKDDCAGDARAVAEDPGPVLVVRHPVTRRERRHRGCCRISLLLEEDRDVVGLDAAKHSCAGSAHVPERYIALTLPPARGSRPGLPLVPERETREACRPGS